LLEEWKDSITVPIYKKTDKTNNTNYRGTSIISTTYKILSSILLSRLTTYAEENTGDNQWNYDAECKIIYSALVKFLNKMGNQRKRASAAYRPQESLLFR